MALDLLTGAVAGLIFAILAMVSSPERSGGRNRGRGPRPLKKERRHELVSFCKHRVRRRRGFVRRRSPGAWRRARGGGGDDAIARQPEAAGTISRTLFVGLAMIETMAIYCLVIAFAAAVRQSVLK